MLYLLMQITGFSESIDDTVQNVNICFERHYTEQPQFVVKQHVNVCQMDVNTSLSCLSSSRQPAFHK